jgi:hypothetical protein
MQQPAAAEPHGRIDGVRGGVAGGCREVPEVHHAGERPRGVGDRLGDHLREVLGIPRIHLDAVARDLEVRSRHDNQRARAAGFEPPHQIGAGAIRVGENNPSRRRGPAIACGRQILRPPRQLVQPRGQRIVG